MEVETKTNETEQRPRLTTVEERVRRKGQEIILPQAKCRNLTRMWAGFRKRIQVIIDHFPKRNRTRVFTQIDLQLPPLN